MGNGERPVEFVAFGAFSRINSIFYRSTFSWEQRKLGEVGSFTSNGVDKLRKPNEENVNLLNYMDVYNRRNINAKNCCELMQVTAKKSQIINNNVLAGDVYFTPTSETADDIGHVMVIEENLPNTVYSYHLMRFRPNSSVFYLTYPNYGFDTFELHKQMELKAKGVQRFVISKPDFESLKITMPKYEEQKKIARLFSNLDTLITLHQRKYLCKKLTWIFIIHVFCFSWEQRKLGEIADFSKGCGYSKGDLREADTPIILYGRLYTKYQFEIIDVDTYVIAKPNSVYSQGGEVIIPASGETAEDIARASSVIKSGILLGGDLNIVKPFSFMNPSFLALTISNGQPKNALSKMAQGKSVVHIHNSDIQKVSITYPNRKEQDNIVHAFVILDTLITLHQRKQI